MVLINLPKEIANKIGVNNVEKISRFDICKVIKQRLLFLEKYSTNKDKNKYSFIIIPCNHTVYNFPLNLVTLIVHRLSLRQLHLELLI